jgi:UDP-N-acetylglucosamine 2-epimerase (non-hydrolysing)
MTKQRVTIIVGTRPELIRLSKIIARLHEVFDVRLIHTGQNSDPTLSEVFIKELGIRKPDLFLGIKSQSLGQFLGQLFIDIEKEFDEFRPDAVVILGDTNSALSGIIAKRRGIPIYHLEAGNRSFDSNVPEEINRKIIDHFSDFNLAYTTFARNNLLSEGLHPRNSIVTGSPLFEVLANSIKQIEDSNILKELNLEARKYFLVSAHRQENIDDPSRLKSLAETLNNLAVKYEQPVVCSLHPRMKSKIDALELEFNRLVEFHAPFGFFDYNKLQINSRMVLSDSGSISEESAILGFKAITIRDSMERPEALEAGSIVLAGIESAGVLRAIEITESESKNPGSPAEYLIENTTERVVKFIASTLPQHGFWSGLRRRD